MLQASDKFMRIREVCERTGLGPSTLYELIQEGEFSRPYKLSGGAVGWRESEVLAWMNSRPVVEPERTTKLCCGCGEAKVTAKFYAHATTPDSLSYTCKSCVRAGKKRLRASRADAA